MDYRAPDEHRALSWAVLLCGLTVWICLQGYLILMPLWTRAALPEPDDTLTYVARAVRADECPSYRCPALRDLDKQFYTPTFDPQVYTYREWAASVFGSNQPLFGLILVALKKAGLEMMDAYKALYYLSPLLFGIGFACLLSVIWGRQAAGIALVLLAFKVFPQTGINFLVPSNFNMGLAMLLWARIIARKGAAPWSMGIGSVVLIAMHPLGAVYAVIGGCIALFLSGSRWRRALWISVAVLGAAFLIALILPQRIYNFSLNLPGISVAGLLAQGTASIATVVVEVLRLKDGLLGPLGLFLGLLALGFATAPGSRRKRAGIVTLTVIPFLIVGLFYPPRSPGDVFLRLWIPLVAILFGAVGSAISHVAGLSRDVFTTYRHRSAGEERLSLAQAWPVVLLAVAAGYVLETSAAGVEQIVISTEHMRSRQPLAVCSSQIKMLMSRAKPQDRVVYTSMLVMPYYFIHGALKLGAVYYDPVLKDNQVTKRCLADRNIHFAVAYNPLMHHPALQGLHERRWGTSGPQFHYSPINQPPRKYGPVLEEDAIPMEHYKWMDIEPAGDSSPRILKVRVDNAGVAGTLHLTPVSASGQPLTELTVTRTMPGRSHERVKAQHEFTPDFAQVSKVPGSRFHEVRFSLSTFPDVRRYRLVVSGWKSRVRIGGISFDESPLNWPWELKSKLLLMHNRWEVGPISFTFDPTKLVPPPLNTAKIEVLNDCGSSVLLSIDRVL